MTELEQLYARKLKADSNPEIKAAHPDLYLLICTQIARITANTESCLPLNKLPPHLMIDFALIYAISVEIHEAKGDFNEAAQRWLDACLTVIAKDRAERGEFTRGSVQGVFL
jgi:hypothetical protein